MKGYVSFLEGVPLFAARSGSMMRKIQMSMSVLHSCSLIARTVGIGLNLPLDTSGPEKEPYNWRFGRSFSFLNG